MEKEGPKLKKVKPESLSSRLRTADYKHRSAFLKLEKIFTEDPDYSIELFLEQDFNGNYMHPIAIIFYDLFKEYKEDMGSYEEGETIEKKLKRTFIAARKSNSEKATYNLYHGFNPSP